MYLVSVSLGDIFNCLSFFLNCSPLFSVPCSNGVVGPGHSGNQGTTNGSELSNLPLALKICSSVSITMLATNRADKNRLPCLTDHAMHTSLAQLLPADSWTLLSLVPHKCMIASNLSYREPSFSPLSIYPLGLSLPSPCTLLLATEVHIQCYQQGATTEC